METALKGTGVQVQAVNPAIVRIVMPEAMRNDTTAMQLVKLAGEVRVPVENPCKVTIDQVSEFGRALPREMMIVMRANALIRIITRKLAIDVDAHERAMYGEGTGGRGLLGLSLGGFMGGDVGRRVDRRRASGHSVKVG